MDAELKKYIADFVERSDLHLVDIVARKQGVISILEVFADSEKGISADKLAETSRRLSQAIDEDQLLRDPYTLVLSSPGLDRPLQFDWQFSRHQGRMVNVRYVTGGGEEAAAKKSEVTGMILENSAEALTLDVEGNRISIPHSDISNAEIKITL